MKFTAAIRPVRSLVSTSRFASPIAVATGFSIKTSLPPCIMASAMAAWRFGVERRPLNRFPYPSADPPSARKSVNSPPDYGAWKQPRVAIFHRTPRAAEKLRKATVPGESNSYRRQVHKHDQGSPAHLKCDSVGLAKPFPLTNARQSSGVKGPCSGADYHDPLRSRRLKRSAIGSELRGQRRPRLERQTYNLEGNF